MAVVRRPPVAASVSKRTNFGIRRISKAALLRAAFFCAVHGLFQPFSHAVTEARSPVEAIVAGPSGTRSILTQPPFPIGVNTMTAKLINTIQKFHRDEEGLEALQVVMIIAIAAMVMIA